MLIVLEQKQEEKGKPTVRWTASNHVERDTCEIRARQRGRERARAGETQRKQINTQHKAYTILFA